VHRRDKLAEPPLGCDCRNPGCPLPHGYGDVLDLRRDYTHLLDACGFFADKRTCDAGIRKGADQGSDQAAMRRFITPVLNRLIDDKKFRMQVDFALP